jgi:hypothetical protein
MPKGVSEMADREKLIDLLDDFPVQMEWHDNADLANYLLSNGVRLETKQATSDKTSEENKRLIECLRFCADDVSDCKDCPRWEHNCGSTKCVNDLLLSAANELDKQRVTDNNAGCKWIPVTERLPEPEKCVLIYSKHGRVAEGKRNRFGIWTQFRWSVTELRGVTHWMPLPEPPKEVE